MALHAGDKLGPYEILAPIGEGGMGEVWKARDTRLDRIVAIKTSKSAFTERFEREARAVASLNHPNICQLYDVGPNYLVMEYVEGPHLQGPMPVEKAVEIAGQILDALDAAHRKRITHRDLKPANIIVTRQGVKLLDFGLAKLEAPLQATDATLVAAATSKGEIVGTLQYMAPEQLQSKPVDARSDLFSFGCVLYELLTGRQAFSGESTASVIASILEREPPPANMPAPLERILKTCLEKDPERRFQNALDLKRNLHWALERSKESDPDPRKARRTLPLWAGAALLLAGLAAGLAYKLRSNAPALSAVPLTRVTRDGRSFSPALSPDGKMLAFVSGRDDQFDIYVQQSGGIVPLRITDDPADDTAPAFSADGTRIYFHSRREPSGIYEVPALGGDARLFQANAGLPKPSPDGKYVAMSNGPLILKPVNGGETRKITDFPATPIVWAPDSSQLIIRRKELLLLSLDGKTRELPLEANLGRRNMWNGQWSKVISWLPDQSLLLTSPLGDAINLWRIPLKDAEHGEFTPITLGTSYNMMEADAVPGRLAFTTNNTVNGIFSLPCDLNTGKVQGPLTRLTAGQSDGGHTDLSMDGSMMVYSSRRSGSSSLWLRNLNTGKERLLAQPTRVRDSLAHVIFSPDGKRIAATQNTGPSGAGWKIVTMDTKGGELADLFLYGSRLRGWSPDGRFLILWSPDRFSRIGVLDVSTRKSTQIIQRGDDPFTDPRLSPDGRWLAFVDKDSRLRIAPFHGADLIPESEWVAIAENVAFPFWSPDGNSIYYAPAASGTIRRTLQRQALQADTKRPSGSPSHFYTIEGASLANPIVNPISIAKDKVVMVLQEPSADVWTMDLR